MSTTAGPPVARERRRDRESVAVGKLHVEQHGVRRLGCDRRKRFRGVGRLAGNDVPAALEELPRDRAKRLVVVDDQHPLHHVQSSHTAVPANKGFPWNSAISVETLGDREMMIA